MSIYDDTALIAYIGFRQSTQLNHHRAGFNVPDYETLLSRTVKFVQQDLPTDVVSTRAGDPNFLLELGVRQWAGCGTPQNKPLAAAKWIFLAIHQKDVPPSLRAQAHSSLARNWLELAVEGGPGTMNITHLYDAGNSANEAAALGLVSTAVLEVAQRIESAGFRRPKDNRFPEHSTERFERLTDLWKALDARIALEMAEEDSKREAKVSKDPLSYFCASEDCGIVVTKSTLRKCGGRCPPALKPSYCSKHCQKTDRKHHELYCKPNATQSSVRSANRTSATTVEQRPNPLEDAGSEGIRHRRTEWFFVAF